MSNTFYIILPSDVPFPPDNSNNKFRVHLPKTLRFNSTWNCGLSSIIYPRSYASIGAHDDQFIKIKFAYSSNGVNGFIEEQIPFPKGNYASAFDLEKSLNSAIQKFVRKPLEESQSRFKRSSAEEGDVNQNFKTRRLTKRSTNVSSQNQSSNSGRQQSTKSNLPAQQRTSAGQQQQAQQAEQQRQADLAAQQNAAAQAEQRRQADLAAQQNAAALAEQQKLAQEAETQRRVSEAERQKQASEAEQQRLAAEVERQRQASEAETQRLAEQQRLAAEAERAATLAQAEREEREEERKQAEQAEKERLELEAERQQAERISQQRENSDFLQSQTKANLPEQQRLDPKSKEEREQATFNFWHATSFWKINSMEELFKFIRIEYKEDTKRFNIYAAHPLINSISFTEQLGYALGFKSKENFKHLDTSDYPPDLSAGINHLYVYTKDLTENLVVGDKLASLLRIVTVKGQYGEYVESIYENPIMSKVVPNEISEIEIEIRGPNGRLIPFEWGTVILVLVFKKVTFL